MEFATKPALATEMITVLRRRHPGRMGRRRRSLVPVRPANGIAGKADQVRPADRLQLEGGHRQRSVSSTNCCCAATTSVAATVGRGRSQGAALVFVGVDRHHRCPRLRWALLARRNDTTGELAHYHCYSPAPVTLAELVRVAGRRWDRRGILPDRQRPDGIDQHQLRTWTSWHRWTVLVMLAHAFLAAATATPAHSSSRVISR